MEEDAVQDLYDRSYAEAYDDRFLLDAWPKQGLDFEVEVLRGLLDRPDVRWLDAGCGTGHVLSLFPEVDRAGIDLSPEMLRRAEAANPDARFLRQADFRVDVEDWHGAWDVVSCMWSAYQYVDSMPEVDRVFENLSGWVKPGGALFVPLSDLEDLRYVDVPYEEDPDVWYGTIALTGVTWNWEEAGTGKFHRHLVAPQAGHAVRLVEPFFGKVEILRYPPFFPGGISRKALLATGRRAPGEEGTAEVVFHPAPRHPDDVAAEAEAAAAASRAEEEHERAQAEAARAELERTEAEGEMRRQIHRDQHELEYLRGEVHRLHRLVNEASDRAPEPASSASTTSTRGLAVELANRLNPLKAGFAGRVKRKLRR